MEERTKIKISQVVSEFLDELGLGEAEYSRAYRIAVRGARELQFDVYGTPKTQLVSVSCDGTAEKPEDCVKVLSVGLSGEYETRGLTQNSNLSKYESYRPDISGKSHWSMGRGSWTDIGEYKDMGDYIILSPAHAHCGNVVIEYLSMVDDNGEYTIHPMASEALIAFIKWKWFNAKKNQSVWDKRDYERNWWNEKKNARMRIKSPSAQLLNQHARKNTKLGIRS